MSDRNKTKPRTARPDHPEPAAVRRKLTAEFRRLAAGRRFTDAERATFAAMADGWEKTLHEDHKISVDGHRKK
jgi:hypothetical protein